MENKDVYFNYLEDLRKSGVTNMFGATPYLEAEFEELSHAEAVEILKEWMKNYNELSIRLGWDRGEASSESGEEIEVESPEAEYSKLFDEEIDREIVDSFLKSMADQELMKELDNAKHIWFIEGFPFIVSYEDGSGKLFNLIDSRITAYGDKLEEFCDDFGLDFEEARQAILDKTGIDFRVEEEIIEPEEDEEEVYDYGTDSVIADEEEVVEEN